MSLSLANRNLVYRIDRDRRSLASRIVRRIESANRAGQPLQQAIAPLALSAYYEGLRRAALDAGRSLRMDVRVAHHDLSREDEKKDQKRLLWLLAWLGLSFGTVSNLRAQADQIAAVAAREIRRGAEVQTAKQAIVEPKPSVYVTQRQMVTAGRTYEPMADVALPKLPIYGPGRGVKLPASLVETWAETVATTQYEAGRGDVGKHYPAVAEALWGYRWSSVLDTHTTQGCRDLDGWVAPASDTRMQALKPPRHWNCRSVLIPVYQSSSLQPPTPQHAPSAATFDRLLAQKEQFLRYLA